MGRNGLLALAVGGVALAMLSPLSATAGDLWSRHGHHGDRVVDPYGYHYEQRGYYPYYNSGYWKPRHEVALKRARFVAPKYFPAWGANRKHWNQAKWHADHHSDDRRGHR